MVGGLSPIRAESVINKSSSQTSSISEIIFFPGEARRPVLLDVLRVLDRRPFILQSWQMNVEFCLSPGKTAK